MIAFVLGTRPEILKLGPVIDLIPPDQRQVIWTGQHWSHELARDVWLDADFVPDVVLHPTHNRQTLLDPIAPAHRLADYLWELTTKRGADTFTIPRPNRLVVQGDTDSALAGALVGAKLDIPVYHVESGGRSGNRHQPEELNRILIDHIADFHAASYPCDVRHLEAEGIKCSGCNGDTLIDSLLATQEKMPRFYAGNQVVATVHRAETLNDRHALGEIMAFLAELSSESKVALYAHPHLTRKVAEYGLPTSAAVEFRDPQRPTLFRSLVAQARMVVTDSGGVATEAAWFGVPCLIPRDETEFEDLEACDLVVVGGRTIASLKEARMRLVRDAKRSKAVECAWRGGAAQRIAEELLA